MKKIVRREYLEKRNRVVEYINNNLDKKISISELAEISNLSKFHFHRIIKGLLGESIGQYITRIRVETATLLIRYTNLEIKHIAYQVGYERASSLNKVFKKFYGVSPTEYRKSKILKVNDSVLSESDFKLEEPHIFEISPKEVVYIQTIGEYGKENFDKAWIELNDFVQANEFLYPMTEYFGISYDDPSVTEKDKCRYEACITMNQSIIPTGSIGVKTIKGGKFAIFSYHGDYSNWGEIYDFIFDKWLISSEYELRNQPVMEKYIKTGIGIEETDLNIEIYLPIKKIRNEI